MRTLAYFELGAFLDLFSSKFFGSVGSCSTFLRMGPGNAGEVDMALRVATNVASLTAQRFADKAQRGIQKSLQRLSSGSKHVTGGGDSTNFAIGEQLRADISGMKQARQNAEQAISFVQVAEGGLNEQFNILVRLRELAVQSASDTISDTEREFVDEEFQQLSAEFDRIARSTMVGDRQILTQGQQSFNFMVGPNGGIDDTISVTIDANTTASNLQIDGLSVTDRDDSQDVLETLDEALIKMAGVRSSFGAIQGRLYHASDNLQVQTENIAEARSRIVDTDIAEETAELTRNKILQETSTAVLAQANMAPNAAFKLIG